MRGRAAEIAGAVAVGLLVVLLAMAFIPPRGSDVTSVSGADSILGTPSPSAEPTVSPSASPTPTPTPSDEPTPSPTPEEVAIIPEGERAGISVQVVNAGAPTGAAGEMSGRLIAAGFNPRPGGNAVEAVPSTLVIHADGAETEARTVNSVVQAAPDALVTATVEDPNWAAFGEGLDVLVVLGPGLP